MHALIDLDILCYEMGSAKDEEGEPLDWTLVEHRVNSRIDQIINAAQAISWQGYLTGTDNFRELVATIRPYKGKRNRGDRPFWYQGVYNFLRDERDAIVVDNYEADDAIAIAQVAAPHLINGVMVDTVICSRDKDLMMVPGKHYSWSFFNSVDTKTVDLAKIFWPELKKAERHVIDVDKLYGTKFYYCQLLTGDSVDNIPGLYGVGYKSSLVKRVREAENELDCFKIVKEQYELRFGTYWDMFMCENGKLLWMLRDEDDDWYDRQKDLTDQLNNQLPGII